MLDPSGEYYIVPGGRWEKGETVEEALCRELLKNQAQVALLEVTIQQRRNW